jgi:hypothetical protein
MEVGYSGPAGEVVWVSFTDFILDPTTAIRSAPPSRPYAATRP